VDFYTGVAFLGLFLLATSCLLLAMVVGEGGQGATLLQGS